VAVLLCVVRLHHKAYRPLICHAGPSSATWHFPTMSGIKPIKIRRNACSIGTRREREEKRRESTNLNSSTHQMDEEKSLGTGGSVGRALHDRFLAAPPARFRPIQQRSMASSAIHAYQYSAHLTLVNSCGCLASKHVENPAL
jgi:hypothetical protein